MSLRLYHDSRPEVPEAVVFCDLELVDDCHALVELGEHRGWTDQQFRDLAQSGQYSWRFDPRTHRYVCPPCDAADRERRQPTTLASEGFAVPFGVAAHTHGPDDGGPTAPPD